MFQDDLPDLAVRGESGIDLFRRVEDEGHRRVRFRCLATLLVDGTLSIHAPELRPDPARLTSLAQALPGNALSAPLSLTDASGWPSAAAGGDPIRLFLYLDFFRAWQVAELAGARLEGQLARSGAAALPDEPGRLTGAVMPLYDFNRLGRGTRLAEAMVPILAQRLHSGFRDDRHGGTGYALRMLGDLCLRAGDPALAFRCYDTAVLAGDNAFRRRKAIEAARAAGDAEAAARHRAGYAARWKLPPDLAETGDAA